MSASGVVLRVRQAAEAAPMVRRCVCGALFRTRSGREVCADCWTASPEAWRDPEPPVGWRGPDPVSLRAPGGRRGARIARDVVNG